MTGALAALRRYPVKSMLGEELREADLTARGVAGDRALAVLDQATGRVASAKHPRLWRGLLAVAAAGQGSIRLWLPDGTVVLAGDPDASLRLSRLLGRAVRLVEAAPPGAAILRAVPEEVLARGIDSEVAVQESRLGGAAPDGTFFDYAPLHLVTTSTLARLGALSPRAVAEAARYRPNLVVETEAAGFPENGWAGRVLAVGDEVRLRVLTPAPRCAVPTLAHGDLPPDPDALRVPMAHNRVPIAGLGPVACVGVYADVLRAGRVRCGDSVRLLAE